VKMELSPKDLLGPANLLSLSRIPIAVVMTLFYSNRAIFFALLAAAIITDLLDGYIARKTRLTLFGAFLDPLCDKVFFAILLIFLLSTSRIALWQLFLLLLRDMFMLGLVVLSSFHRNRHLLEKNVKARWPGKIVTAAQFVALIWLFLGGGNFSLAVSAVAAISVVAIIDYVLFVKKTLSE
jgi:CDP-diacylglycerol---glycerol-3-phosphate 3-phosphatidyltransferase